MTHIETFSNGEFQLHVTQQADTFSVFAEEVAHALGVRDGYTLVRNLANDEKHYVLERGRQVWHLDEPGLYRVIGQRQSARIKDQDVKAQVDRFQRWLFHEVLPSLRRTGKYVIPGQSEVRDFFEPCTLTWDEACALIRQRYGIPMGANELTRSLRTAGVLKQTGAPRKDWAHAFWFTGSSWNVHPHMVPELTRKVVDVGRELHDFRMLQAQLELEGVGSPAILEREVRPLRQRGVSSGPVAREDEPDRPGDNRP